MLEPTIHQLECFDAVVTEGSFQAAAARLFRSQPAVFASVKALESQLGFALLDRSGYRVRPTAAGRSFQQRARILLGEMAGLCGHAAWLAAGDEAELRIVIGDLCPLAPMLGLLRTFFDACPGTRLHLSFEAISGPWERLLDGDADLILHHIDKSDARLEYLDLAAVRLVPVAAPGFLAFAVTDSITPEMLRGYAQCIIRDSARHTPTRDYFVVEGARSWTVSDQLMKKELIVQGMGWGHMPEFLVADELRTGRLLSLAGHHLRGGMAELVAARRRLQAHGPVAERLWHFVGERRRQLAPAAAGEEPGTAADRTPPAASD